jgi:hypothetical protein
MRRIFKYPLDITDVQFVNMAEPVEILSVQTQNGLPFVWALVDDEKPPVRVQFDTHGTGHPVTGSGKFLGTYQMNKGALVFHVFHYHGVA